MLYRLILLNHTKKGKLRNLVGQNFRHLALKRILDKNRVQELCNSKIKEESNFIYADQNDEFSE